MQPKLYQYAIWILVFSFSGFIANAQTGWQWGIANTASGSGFDGYCSAIDRMGNEYSGAYIYSGSGNTYFDSLAVGVYGGGMIVTKNDTNGHYIWAKGSIATTGLPIDMVADTAGNLYFLGYYYTHYCIFGTDTLVNPMGGYAPCACFLMKFSATGNVVWMRNIKVDSNEHHQSGGIGIDVAGNLYVTGEFNSASNTIGGITLTNANPGGDSDDVYVVKYAPDGTAIWARSFGGANCDWANCIAITDKGNFYVAGQYQSDTLYAGTGYITGSANFIVKYDSSGNCLWRKNLPQTTIPYAATSDILQNLYITGAMDTATIMGPDTLAFFGTSTVMTGGDMFVSKINSLGNVVWARSAGGDSTDVGWDIAIDSCGQIWVCGSMNEFFGGPGYAMYFGADSIVSEPGLWGICWEPMFVAGYDNAGNYLTSFALTVGGDDWSGINTDGNGNLYISGDYSGYPAFGTDTLAETAEELMFVAKYKYADGGCAFVPTSLPMTGSSNIVATTFPNPFKNEINILSEAGSMAGTKSQLFDMTGRLIVEKALDGTSTMIEVPEIAPGIYLLVLTDKNGLRKNWKLLHE